MLLALTPDVGPILRARLLERFGDAESVIEASEADLQQVQGIGPKISARIVNARHEVQLDAQLALVREHGLGVLLPGAATTRVCFAKFPIRPACCSCAARSSRPTRWPWRSWARAVRRVTGSSRPNVWPQAWLAPASRW